MEQEPGGAERFEQQQPVDEPDLLHTAEAIGSVILPTESEHVHSGYGNCAVCGQDMPADSEPHTFSEHEECHDECCPHCNPDVEQSREVEPQAHPRVYVACLASYNHGILHGQFLDAAVEPDELWQGIAEVLRTSRIPGAEEHAIHDYEGFEGIRIGEYDSVERVTALGRLVVEHGEAFAHWFNNDTSVELEDAGSQFEESFVGQFDDENELQAHIAESCGIDEMMEGVHKVLPGWACIYVEFDIEGYTNDLGYNGDLFTVRGSDGKTYAYWSR